MDEKMWTNGINEASKMALLAWEKETGIELVQINGQRRYGGPPPGWVGGPPPAGTEVYIARLPQDIYENTLIPLFESVGKLYEFRLMMTFSGLNRGFAYARYTSLQDASNAIATFHRFQMRKGCAIVVCRSTQKCELIVNGLDISVSQQELQAMLQMVTEGILSVTLHASPCQRPAKLAVLKYRSHEAAALAKKALTEGNLRLRGAGMRVDWLDPQMKQKLQLWEEEPSSNGVHGDKSLAVPRLAALPPLLECPNILSWRHRLRTPLFTTKCVQDKQGQSEHEKVKMAAALHILQVLGESLVSPCMASVPTSCLSQSLEVSPGSVELWHFWGGVQGGSQAGRQG
uniref:DND microRNA-mediated repression inhibitor 1 n=1 Tax=Corvus moneduloides TaxID=1196302 RepID=A0A8U7NYI9_CORMO